MNINEQNTIGDLERVLKSQKAALEVYKKREAQQLNAVKEAIQKLSKAQAASKLWPDRRATCRLFSFKSKCSWIVGNALEISGFKSDPDRQDALWM